MVGEWAMSLPLRAQVGEGEGSPGRRSLWVASGQVISFVKGNTQMGEDT